MPTAVTKRFDGGMTNDPRDMGVGKARTVQHFDALTDHFRLTPYHSHESGDSSASTNHIGNFQYDGTTLYGLGDTGGGIFKIFTRTNFTDATWTALASVGQAYSATYLPFFTYYKNQDTFYGAGGGQYFWSMPSNGSGGNNTYYNATAYTNVSNGIVHSKDDILYVSFYNSADGTSKVVYKNGSAAFAVALTLPKNMICTQLVEWGNYLGIVCRQSNGQKSRLFLWNRDTSQTTLDESVDLGEGNAMVAEELEGHIIVVSFVGDTGSASLKARMVFRRYSGGTQAVKFAEFTGSGQSPAVQSTLFRQKANNRIYFPASMPIASTSYFGIWSIGRSSQTGEFVVVLDRLLTAAFTGSLSMYGLIIVGDYLFHGYQVNSVWYMDKTDDTTTFNTTSVYESTVNPGLTALESQLKKQLNSAWLAVEPLTSGQQAVLKYRVDGGAWTTIITMASTNSEIVVGEANDANGTSFSAGREYEFRVESTGGAVVTGAGYDWDPINTYINS